VSASSFGWSSVNQLPKPLKYFVRFLRTFFKPDSVGRPSTSKTTDRTHPRRRSPNNPWTRRHRWGQLWSLPGDNRKFVHVPTCSFITTTHPPTRPWKPQSLWPTTCLSFTILPTRRAHTAVIPLSFPNWKWNWRDDVLKQCLTSKGNRKRHSTALKNDFHGAFEAWKNKTKTMGSLYMFPRRLFWRSWQPKLNKLNQYFFFDLVRELSDTPRTWSPKFCTTRWIISEFTYIGSSNDTPLSTGMGLLKSDFFLRICGLREHNMTWDLKAGMVESEKTPCWRLLKRQ
jgi:hypothetical protein